MSDLECTNFKKRKKSSLRFMTFYNSIPCSICMTLMVCNFISHVLQFNSLYEVYIIIDVNGLPFYYTRFDFNALS